MRLGFFNDGATLRKSCLIQPLFSFLQSGKHLIIQDTLWGALLYYLLQDMSDSSFEHLFSFLLILLDSYFYVTLYCFWLSIASVVLLISYCFKPFVSHLDTPFETESVRYLIPLIREKKSHKWTIFAQPFPTELSTTSPAIHHSPFQKSFLSQSREITEPLSLLIAERQKKVIMMEFYWHAQQKPPTK